MYQYIALLLGIVAIAGCGRKATALAADSVQTRGYDDAATQARGPHEYRFLPTKSSEFKTHLLEIAKNYESYGRFDKRMNWAPRMCAPVKRSSLDYSSSDDPDTHGGKLYSVFAFPRAVFASGALSSGMRIAPGQIVVKEAWFSRELPEHAGTLPSLIRHVKSWDGTTVRDEYVPYARKNGRLYAAAAKAALFILFKLDPTTPDTDEGWVYGTVTADSKSISSVGKLQACMSCHDTAPYDHLFGPAKE